MNCLLFNEDVPEESSLKKRTSHRVPAPGTKLADTRDLYITKKNKTLLTQMKKKRPQTLIGLGPYINDGCIKFRSLKIYI